MVDNIFMKEKYIVDRIQSEYYVLETPNGGMINLPKDEVSKQLKEGDVLYKIGDTYSLSEEETKKRMDEIEELMKGMWEE
ncbi:MAG: DUF3006 domain-containing protein [Clostridium sp.]|uniref:DUF3006 domain-containing protein n=1 Tax=Clostridium sp. TaxID=1506 RepID=UPI003F3EE19F